MNVVFKKLDVCQRPYSAFVAMRKDQEVLLLTNVRLIPITRACFIIVSLCRIYGRVENNVSGVIFRF